MLRSRCERIERRHAGALDLEREGETAGHGEPDPRAREASRPRADHDRLDLARPRRGLPKQRVDVLEERPRDRRALAEHLGIVHQRARRDVSCRVESQDQHPRVLVAASRPARSTATRRVSGDVLEAHVRPCRRERADARLGPLDEDDRVLEVRLEVTPLRRREATEAIEVEMRYVDHAPIAVADRERRARHAARRRRARAMRRGRTSSFPSRARRTRARRRRAQRPREVCCGGLGLLGRAALELDRRHS